VSSDFGSPARVALPSGSTMPAIAPSRSRIGARGADASYLPARGRVRSWNRVTPLRAGKEAFPAMLAAIALAEQSICLETYILRADRIGQRFKAALVERARAGVAVRVLYDAVGSIALPADYVAELVDAGAEVIEFHPVAPWRRRFGWNTRDHKKMLIVDHRVAFTGGINIGDEYSPTEEGGGGWHDMSAQVEGPAVRELSRVFASTWEAEGGSLGSTAARAAGASSSPERAFALVEVIANLGAIPRPGMRRAYLHAIRRAQHQISVMNAYFIPDAALRRAFAKAVRRGASVRVVVPSRSDIEPVYYASRNLYARLMRSGVRLFEWQGDMMHAKCAAIDGIWSTIGSYNLDRRSFVHNLEVGLLMIDRELARELEAQFETDLMHCREVDARDWSTRPRWQKLLERFWYLFRYWL
jgi:cardiolipin synthase